MKNRKETLAIKYLPTITIIIVLIEILPLPYLAYKPLNLIVGFSLAYLTYLINSDKTKISTRENEGIIGILTGIFAFMYILGGIVSVTTRSIWIFADISVVSLLLIFIKKHYGKKN